MNKADKSIAVLQIADWVEAIALLSMDLTGPFFTDMGLKVPDLLRFQSVLRDGMGLDERVFREDMTANHPKVVEAILSRLRGVWGSEFMEQFSIWFEDVFRWETGEWVSYRLALTSWAARLGANGADQLGLGPACSELADLHNRLVENPTLHERLSDAKARERSRWDTHVCDLRRYSEDEEAVNRANATADVIVARYTFDGIIRSAEQNGLQLFWEELLRHLDPRSEEKLYGLAQETGVTRPLPVPTQLRRRLRW